MYARRRHRYFVMMGICITLFVLAWGVVRLWSVPAAVAMCVVAMVIPPVAAITANRRGPDDPWWDDPAARPRPGPHRDLPPDSESEAWWAELDGRDRPR